MISRATLQWFGAAIRYCTLLGVYVASTPVAATQDQTDAAKKGDAGEASKTGVAVTRDRIAPPMGYERALPRHDAAVRMGMLGASIRAGLAYRFGVLPRLQIELTCDHLFPHPGLRHLRGFTQTLGTVVWLSPTRSGLFMVPAFAVGEHFLTITPERRSISLGGGVLAGLAFPVFEHLSVAVGAGLRRMEVVSADTSICTDTAYCELTRGDWLVDATVTVSATW